MKSRKLSEAEEKWEKFAARWVEANNKGRNVHRDGLNGPKFLEFLPKHLEKLQGLEIGCGEGYMSRLISPLCEKIHAIDISQAMIRYARLSEKNNPLGIHYSIQDAESLQFAERSFDFAVAFMSVMDVDNPAEVFREVYRVLKPGGFFQLSIVHPCFGTTPKRQHWLDEQGEKIGVKIGEYYKEGGKLINWRLDKSEPFQTIQYHRTLSTWINMMVAPGFRLERMMEPCAEAEIVKANPHLIHTQVAPDNIIFRLRK